MANDMRSTIPAGYTPRPSLPVDANALTVPVAGWATWEDYCRALEMNPKLARLSDVSDFYLVLNTWEY